MEWLDSYYMATTQTALGVYKPLEKLSLVPSQLFNALQHTKGWESAWEGG